MTKDGKLGVCVIGCGDMGHDHSYAWVNIPEAEPRVIVGRDEAECFEMMERYGFQEWTNDYTQVLSRDDIDIVSICVPTYFHPEMSIRCLEAGKHVLCEKPIALTLAEAESVLEAVQKTKSKFTLSFQRRHSAEFEKIKAAVNEGALGRPIMSVFHSFQEIRPKRAMHDAKYGNGGPIIDCVCHYVDFWRGIFSSEPVSVSACGFTLAQERPELAHFEQIAPDTANICIQFASGDIGVILVSWGLPPGVNGESLWEFIGPKGLLYPGFDNMKIITDGGLVKVTESPKMRVQITRDFMDCILQDKDPKVSAYDGLAALKVSLAALESMKTGIPVKIN